MAEHNEKAFDNFDKIMASMDTFVVTDDDFGQGFVAGLVIALEEEKKNMGHTKTRKCNVKGCQGAPFAVVMHPDDRKPSANVCKHHHEAFKKEQIKSGTVTPTWEWSE